MPSPLTFNPVRLSNEENTWLLANLGKPPLVALREQLPPKVNIKAVEPILRRVEELKQAEAYDGSPWVGLEALKESISTFLAQSGKWSKDQRLGRPRWPSMSSIDERGRAHRQAPGSDAGEVSTYFNSDGSRRKFAVDYVPLSQEAWTPDWQGAKTVTGIHNEADKNRIVCNVCAHTESYNPNSRKSETLARARMSKHLRKAVDNKDAHRETHSNEFGS